MLEREIWQPPVHMFVENDLIMLTASSMVRRNKHSFDDCRNLVLELKSFVLNTYHWIMAQDAVALSNATF